jgi:hypothetical protein
MSPLPSPPTETHVDLAFAGFVWKPLSLCALEPVAEAFDDDDVVAWLCGDGERALDALRRRVEREHDGDSLILVGFDAIGRPTSLAGLSTYWELDTLQTWSYVRRDRWGCGLNAVNYALTWALAHHVLGRDSVVAAVDVRNARSVAAHRKLFPSAAVEEAVEPWVPRLAARFTLDRPPVGAPGVEAAVVDQIAALVAPLPAARRWEVGRP